MPAYGPGAAPAGLLRRLGLGRAPATYAEDTHGSPFWIVRYAHQQRALVAVEMILETQPRTVVDWGTGDGFVIERLLDEGRPCPELVLCFEPEPYMVRQLGERIAAHPRGDRVRICETVEAVAEALEGRKVDVCACLGVLEHLPLAPRRTFYDFARDHLAPDASLIIDVPIEHGPALLVKELGRRVLKGRPLEYPARELLRRSVGRTHRDPARYDDDGSVDFIPAHSDFDHRQLMAEVAQEYRIVERRNTPLRWAPSWAFNQEVIFRATPIPGPAA